MCNRPIFIQSTLVWRASWSTSVLSTALPHFVRGSCLSWFWFVSAPPRPASSIWVMKIMSSVFLSHAFQLQCFLYVAVSVCWTVSISLKPSIGVYMWQYVVIQECISWFLRLLLLLVSISLSFMLILCSLIPRSCSCAATDLESWSSYLVPSLNSLWCSLSLNSVQILGEFSFIMPLIF